MLSVLLENQHRVVSRGELSRLAGLEGLSERRCDSVLVQIRRYLGAALVFMTLAALGALYWSGRML